MEYVIQFTDTGFGQFTPVVAFSPECGALHFAGESGMHVGFKEYATDINRNLHRILDAMDSKEWEDMDDEGVAQFVKLKLDNGLTIRVCRYL